MVPVSRRGAGEEAAMGNRIAFVFITLPVDVSDPLARLGSIRAETAAFKGTGRAGGGEALLQGLGLLPLPLQAPLARFAASPRMYNLVISNVPGPRMPVYLLGAECVEVLPAIPLSDGHTLSVGVFSLRDRLCFGAYADPEALPQARELPGRSAPPPTSSSVRVARAARCGWSPDAADRECGGDRDPRRARPAPRVAGGRRRGDEQREPERAPELRGGVEQAGREAGAVRVGTRARSGRRNRRDAEAAADEGEGGEQRDARLRADGEPARPGGHRGEAARHPTPLAGARGDARPQQRAHHDREAHRHEEQARLRRGEAACALDVQDAQERRRGRLAPGDPYAWAWERPDPLWPVAVAAVDLLRDPERLARVKRCAQCSWLFLDRSRNGSRRWCSMGECGAQVKMRRYRAARRGG